MYYRSGVSIKETGPLAAADSDSWSTHFFENILASIFCCFVRKITFPSRY
ncbi:hypothetical protein PFWH6_0313 [Pseudomonas fluorescens WH6]|nr:hypothetical protein PFWH6_0313 [Pseudomonas fluorescens WH6]